MRKQVETWLGSELTDVNTKVVIYEAFVEGKLEARSIFPELCMSLANSGGAPSMLAEPSRRDIPLMGLSGYQARIAHWESHRM
jgi:hypothetical protein